MTGTDASTSWSGKRVRDANLIVPQLIGCSPNRLVPKRFSAECRMSRKPTKMMVEPRHVQLLQQHAVVSGSWGALTGLPMKQDGCDDRREQPVSIPAG